ncbi:acyltransferase family protein [Inhella inkyongensis]|nr:acyltransferase family protein [Inhella inkyongensis]
MDSGTLRALDKLRALAMLAGLFFHASLAHSPLVQPFFPTADASQAAGLDWVLWPLHLVRMPLFFVIAGLFAARSLARRGMADWMRERARRLLLPLLAGCVLIHVLMAWLFDWAARTVQRPSPMLAWWRTAQAQGLQLPWGTGHLWFLYYLLLLGVLLWVARLLLPARLKTALRELPLWVWALGLPLLLTPALASVSAPHPAPEGLLPQFWALFGFGAYFVLGYLIGPRLAELKRTRWLTLLGLGGALASAGFLALLDSAKAQAGWVLGGVSAVASVWLTLGLLGLALRGLQGGPRVLRYLAESSYWVYLVHLPVLFALQFAWMDAPWSWGLKLPLAVLSTLLMGLISYELIGRRLLSKPR